MSLWVVKAKAKSFSKAKSIKAPLRLFVFFIHSFSKNCQKTIFIEGFLWRAFCQRHAWFLRSCYKSCFNFNSSRFATAVWMWFTLNILPFIQKQMNSYKMEHHIRQTHLHTHTSSDLLHKDIQNVFHYLSLFGCAVLTHNMEFSSFSLHIKRSMEKQLGFFSRPSCKYTHTVHTHLHFWHP